MPPDEALLAAAERLIRGPQPRVSGGATIRLKVKVAPGASRNAIDGWLGDTLKVRVTASPERGKANLAVERLLAQVLGIPKSNARVVSGQTSARKVLELAGVSQSEAIRKLSGDAA